MIQLGKDKFIVPQPGCIRTFALQQTLIPVAGNITAALMSLVVGKKLENVLAADIIDVIPTALPRLGRVFSEMKPGDLEHLMRTLLGDPKTGAPLNEVATINGAPLFTQSNGDAFDMLMKGRHVDTWRLLAHALEVWYPDFFGLVQPFIALAKKGKDSEESNTSPTSGPASA